MMKAGLIADVAVTDALEPVEVWYEVDQTIEKDLKKKDPLLGFFLGGVVAFLVWQWIK